MDLIITDVEISKRKVRINLSHQQWVDFFPFGKLDYICNTSDFIYKKDIRFIGNILNKTPSFRETISQEDLKKLNEELINKKVKSILN